MNTKLCNLKEPGGTGEKAEPQNVRPGPYFIWAEARKYEPSCSSQENFHFKFLSYSYNFHAI